jgi:hypothetical protein
VQRGEESSVVEYRNGNPSRIQSFDGAEFRFSYGDGARQGQLTAVEGPNDLAVRYGFDAAGLLSTVNVVGLYRVQYARDRCGCISGCGIGQ